MRLVRRLRDLAIKALIHQQWRSLRPLSPRLAVIPHEHVGLAVVTNGLYEREELACIAEIVARRHLGAGICLDIGANIGNHAVIFSGLFEKVFCFEPNPPIAAVLRANLLLNACANVTIFEFGLGDRDAEMPFSIEEAGNDGSGTFAGNGGDRTLPVRHADALIAGLGLPDGAIKLIKCDVEGFEPAVFRGLQDALRRHRPVVIFESNLGAAGSDTWGLLQGCGYTQLYELRHSAASLPPILRELSRAVSGHRCWIEPVTSIPAHNANLIASTKALV